MHHSFFKDLKVIELASVLAGPAVGLFFAELGAKVIKVENKQKGGDVTRNWRLPQESKDSSYSAYFCSVNWNKESIFLDLKNETDKEFLYNLVIEADIIISNFKDSSAHKIGCSYQQIKKINSSIIFAHLTAFGLEESRPAFDIVLQAETGFLYMNGEAGRNPVRMPVALIDILAAHQLKEAVLIALIHKLKTGEGSYVTTSLLEAAISSLANQATNYLMVDHIPERMGCLHPNIAPYGDIFFTKDRKAIILAAGTERQWIQLCKSIGAEDLPENELFIKNSDRVRNRAELSEILGKKIATYLNEELLKKLHTNGVPIGSIRNMKEVFELPIAQKMILEEKMDDGIISKRVKTVAFQMESKKT